jgi:tol-pal system protein YbgF
MKTQSQSVSLFASLKAAALSAALVVGFMLATSAHAGMFSDDEARQAILDLREEVKQFQRSMLEMQNQFEALRTETARLRGEKEELMQELRHQKDMTQGVDERLKKFEPNKILVDGVEFIADPAEIKAYDAALALFRKGEFNAASAAFADFIKKNPKSGYVIPSLFWLGNAQYANRDYASAIRNFSTLLSREPNHMRAPDAMLSIANCQLDLKDIKQAMKTLDTVVKTYPLTEAASAAKERLSKLK